jgi:transcription antitermination factor NusG
MSQNWYAIYTKPQWEKKVTSILKRKKFKSYCPLVNKAGIKKNTPQPLFPSYVFVQATPEEMPAIKQTQGVINFVYWLNQPAIIKNNEIDAIKEFIDDYKDIRLEKTEVSMNDNVLLIGDSATIMGDKVILVKNRTMKAVLPSLGFSIIAEADYSKAKVIYAEIGMKRSVS